MSYAHSSGLLSLSTAGDLLPKQLQCFVLLEASKLSDSVRTKGDSYVAVTDSFGCGRVV